MPTVAKLRVVVYTVITSTYDLPMPLPRRQSDVDYVLLTDRPADHPVWDARPLPDQVRQLRPVNASRWCKFFAHLIFPEYDISVYVDGNISIIGSLALLIEEFAASGASMGLFAHPTRKTVSAEIQACERHSKLTARDRLRLDQQIERYRHDGVLDLEALTENGVIFRNHRAADLNAAMNLWWREFMNGVGRDQVSLPWVRKVTRLDCLVWPWSYRYDKKRFAGPFTHFFYRREMRFARLRYHLMLRRKIARQVIKRKTAPIRRRLSKFFSKA